MGCKVSVEISIKIDMPEGKTRGQAVLNRKLWLKLKLPPGWQRRALMDHHNHVGFKITLKDVEQLKEFGEQVAQLESMLLLIRNT